jgi:hypothetical protein
MSDHEYRPEQVTAGVRPWCTCGWHTTWAYYVPADAEAAWVTHARPAPAARVY